MDVPYCIVKGKARLGQLVHKKNAAVVCLTGVRDQDQNQLAKIVESARANFNDRAKEISRSWGGGIMGEKTNVKVARALKAKEKEMLAKLG